MGCFIGMFYWDGRVDESTELRSESDRFLLHLWQRVGFAPGLAPLGGLDLAGLLCYNRSGPIRRFDVDHLRRETDHLKQLEAARTWAWMCNSYQTPVRLLKWPCVCVYVCVYMWVCLGLFESSSHADSFDDCLLCCFHMTLASLFFLLGTYFCWPNWVQTSCKPPNWSPGMENPLDNQVWFHSSTLGSWAAGFQSLQLFCSIRQRNVGGMSSHMCSWFWSLFFHSLICKLHQVAKFHSTWVDFKSSSLGTSWDQLAFMYDSISCFGSCSGTISGRPLDIIGHHATFHFTFQGRRAELLAELQRVLPAGPTGPTGPHRPSLCFRVVQENEIWCCSKCKTCTYYVFTFAYLVDPSGFFLGWENREESL